MNSHLTPLPLEKDFVVVGGKTFLWKPSAQENCFLCAGKDRIGWLETPDHMASAVAVGNIWRFDVLPAWRLASEEEELEFRHRRIGHEDLMAVCYDTRHDGFTGD
jgi:hypothetical protein